MLPELIYPILIFFVGVILGSFYNVCIFRIPREQSVAFPASHCTSCDHSLAPADLIPVISWLWLKGRCRYCKERISFRYPLVELITGIIFVLSYLIFGFSAVLIFHLVFASILIIVTFIDIDFRIIPDRFIIIGIIIAGVKFWLIKDVTWKEAVLGGIIGGGVLLFVDMIGRLIFRKEGMGLGDVKLMLMAGSYLGTANTVVALLAAIWIGAIAGIIILRTKREKEGTYMPFGPFLALGSLIALFWGGRIVQYYLSLF